jgi:hypothetical protein
VVGFHVEGFDFTHKVVDIAYDADDKADVTLEPPLRRRLAATDILLFRPTMTCVCMNAREAVGNYLHGTAMSFGPMRMVEALV